MKLWYFRTPKNGYYFLSAFKPSPQCGSRLDDATVDVQYRWEMFLGHRKPRDLPKLAPGEFRPVEVEGR